VGCCGLHRADAWPDDIEELFMNKDEAQQEHEPENEPHVSLASVREDWGPGPHEYHSLPPAQPAPVQECFWRREGYKECPAAQRQWVGLTDEEMRELEKQFEAERVRTSDEEYLVIYPAAYWQWQRAIEAKLKEKNT
jgi:hypothetical protein